jgi:hypothetical protein
MGMGIWSLTESCTWWSEFKLSLGLIVVLKYLIDRHLSNLLCSLAGSECAKSAGNDKTTPVSGD